MHIVNGWLKYVKDYKVIVIGNLIRAVHASSRVSVKKLHPQQELKLKWSDLGNENTMTVKKNKMNALYVVTKALYE